MNVPKASWRSTIMVLAFDMLALGFYLYWIPRVVRPLEVLMAVLFVLGAVTALAVKPAWMKSVAIMAASGAFTIFCLEMAEKYIGITRLVVPGHVVSNTDGVEAAGGQYDWPRNNVPLYLEAKRRAVADGIGREAFGAALAGDIFAGREGLWRRRTHSDGKTLVMEGLKPRYAYGAPLGYEYTPDNVMRHWCRPDGAEGYLFDARMTIGPGGSRETRGNPGGEQAWLFLGCSFTFGYGLNDDQTLPHYFSEATGFTDHVVNLGVSGYGPHQSLRDLVLDRHPGRAGVDPARVKGVVFSLIDDHADRVERPNQPGTPVYGLDSSGGLVFEGNVTESWLSSRLYMLMEKSRIYPNLIWRLRNSQTKGDSSYGVDLTLAIFKEMDRVCRERYGVGLTVVYWNNDSAFKKGLTDAGIRVIAVADAFGSDWRRTAIEYELFDGHPSAYANRKLGRYLAEEFGKNLSE